MGQGPSGPLDLTLACWPEVCERAHNLSLAVKKPKWIVFCRSEWPTFQVGRPPQGSFQLSLIQAVKDVIFRTGPSGHPDQQAYILVWQDLCENLPPWVKSFLPQEPPPKSYKALPLHPTAPPVLPESQADFIHLDMDPPPTYAPSPQSPPAIPSPSPPPSTPQGSDDEGPGPAGNTRGVQQRRAQGPPEAAVTLPLRPFGNPVPDGNGGGEMPSLQYWPFSTSDLYNWRNNNPPFSEDPTKLTGLMDSLMFSHQPTWDDCQQLLVTLFTTEERERILTEARKRVPGPNGQPTILQNIIDDCFPLRRPDWNPNTPQGREHLSIYRQTLMAGLRAASRRPTNLAKVREIIQGKDETPAAFLERIMEAYRRYTPFDPQDENSQGSIAMAFITPSALDIRKKLQRLDGLQTATLRDLVKEAEKVYF
ncbi:PREDICTED: uncharacterized protein LOC106146847, partial [Chinchilla lanigera]|uniref:uncharacterized protein LOC106146847 n=1 Tax=Chinchilla lanigera TaxID=34839 RepID=UPI0006980C4C